MTNESFKMLSLPYPFELKLVSFIALLELPLRKLSTRFKLLGFLHLELHCIFKNFLSNFCVNSVYGSPKCYLDLVNTVKLICKAVTTWKNVQLS